MSILDKKDFIRNVDYLNRLAKEIKKSNLENLDSNLVYEVAYADTYLGMLLANVDDESLKQQLEEIKAVYKGVLETSTFKGVNDTTYDYKKLLSTRYSNLDDASYDKQYEVQSLEAGIRAYIKKTIRQVILLLILSLFVMNNGITLVVNLISTLLGSGSGAGTPSSMQAVLIQLRLVVNSFILILFMVKSGTLAIDLLYISIPTFRTMIPEDKLKVSIISPSAQECVEQCMNKSVLFKSVKDFNRIARNKVWLQIMLDDSRLRGTELEEELLSVKDKLEGFENEKIISKDYFTTCAKIEFLHDNYLVSYE